MGMMRTKRKVGFPLSGWRGRPSREERAGPYPFCNAYRKRADDPWGIVRKILTITPSPNARLIAGCHALSRRGNAFRQSRISTSGRTNVSPPFALLEQQHRNTRSIRVVRVRTELPMGADGRTAPKNGALRDLTEHNAARTIPSVYLFYSCRAGAARLGAPSTTPSRSMRGAGRSRPAGQQGWVHHQGHRLIASGITSRCHDRTRRAALTAL